MTKTDEQQTRKQKGISCFAIFFFAALASWRKTTWREKAISRKDAKAQSIAKTNQALQNKKGTANRALLPFQLADL